MRALHALLVALLLLPAAVAAQDDAGSDSLFETYADYSDYVDKMLYAHDWKPFVQRMGGRDEYSPQELDKIAADFNGLFPKPFTQRTLFREVDLGGGIRQEARAYWGGGRYLFFYAIMHERDDALVVLNFSMNTRVDSIMGKF